MSRSYKKHPWVTDHHVKTTKEKKKFANKKVRGHEDLPNGSAYKKVSESQDICDFKGRWTWKEAKEWYEERKDDPYWSHYFPNLKSYYRYWVTHNKGK